MTQVSKNIIENTHSKKQTIMDYRKGEFICHMSTETQAKQGVPLGILGVFLGHTCHDHYPEDNTQRK